MAAQLINGRTIAQTIRDDIRAHITRRVQAGHRAPGLGVILVGDDPASRIYVRYKERDCKEVGMVSTIVEMPRSATQREVRDQIDRMAQDPDIDGFFVQLPLPEHIDKDTILQRIPPDKDVDGFHPYNMGRLVQRAPTLRPCTPFGVIRMLEHIGEPFKGRHAVIVGASNIVGRPMMLELILAGSTATICHRFTRDLEYHVRQADILVVAVGKPGLVKGEWVKPGATVVDVGINRLDDGTLVGDVEFDIARERAAWITPVPGGVGPMTRAMLLHNTLEAAMHAEE